MANENPVLCGMFHSGNRLRRLRRNRCACSTLLGELAHGTAALFQRGDGV